MTLPKGYVIPNKEAEEKTKREAEEKTKREAEEKTKREAEEKTKREAEEKTKREAEEKTKREAEEKTKREAEEKTKREAEEKTKREAEEKTKREAEEKTILQEPHKDSSVTNNLNSNRLDGNQGNVVKTLENNLNYYMIWEQLREAYLHTLKEATSSYFRLLDFWSQPKNYKE